MTMQQWSSGKGYRYVFVDHLSKIDATYHADAFSWFDSLVLIPVSSYSQWTNNRFFLSFLDIGHGRRNAKISFGKGIWNSRGFYRPHSPSNVRIWNKLFQEGRRPWKCVLTSHKHAQLDQSEQLVVICLKKEMIFTKTSLSLSKFSSPSLVLHENKIPSITNVSIAGDREWFLGVKKKLSENGCLRNGDSIWGGGSPSSYMKVGCLLRLEIDYKAHRYFSNQIMKVSDLFFSNWLEEELFFRVRWNRSDLLLIMTIWRWVLVRTHQGNNS